MKVALVGNNDGPLILAKSMRAKNKHPVCIGLQKPVSGALRAQYLEFLGEDDFFTDFAESRLLEILKTYDFDILVNCFCNFKFEILLDRYTVLNVHLAPLPKYRGRHPLHWALINGEREFGFTVHTMDADFDAGEIHWQKRVSVVSGMSVEELRNALMKELAAGFGGFLEDYEKGTIEPWSNPNSEASYAPKRKPEDSLLTEWHDRDTIFRKVMALRSGNYPAYFTVNGEKIIVTRAEIEEGMIAANDSAQVGQPIADGVIVEQLHENGISLLCPDGKRIGLYGFRPEEHHLTKKQKLL